MKRVIPAQAGRIGGLESTAKSAEPPRTHTFFRDWGQSDADIRAQIEAAKRSGRIKPGDRYYVFRWQAPDDAVSS